MDITFPTFRRLVDIHAWPALLHPWQASWAQRRSLLRLIIVSTEENIPLSQLIDAWANDETGRQSDRLRRLAALLRGGSPLPEAVEQIPRLLGEDDILAIRFGQQSGTLVSTIRERLEQHDPVSDDGAPRLYRAAVYLCIFTIIAIAIVTYWMVRIVPALRAIFSEFEIATPATFNWSVYLASIVADYWYLFALALLAGLLFVASRFGRRLRLQIASRFLRPVRELRVADVLQKLSITTQAGRPLAGALSTLARYHFDPALRHKLLVVRNELEHGAAIWPSMGTIGLLSEPEVRALKTADQVGNQSWVLRQLALVKKRRIARRVARWSQLAMPIMVIILGSFVLLQALSLFDSLVSIIYSLM